MNNDELQRLLEEEGLSPEKIEEVLYYFNNNPKSVDFNKQEEVDLRGLIIDDPDWRKRAALAAQQISNNL